MLSEVIMENKNRRQSIISKHCPFVYCSICLIQLTYLKHFPLIGSNLPWGGRKHALLSKGVMYLPHNSTVSVSFIIQKS